MHEALKIMLQRYQCANTQQCTQALKEIVQEIALVGLWRSKFFEIAAFYGGTALRILYGLDRFSEDLDFSLLKPDPKFSLTRYNKAIQQELEAHGFEVKVDTKIKSNNNHIESAFIKAHTQKELLRINIPEFRFENLHPQSQLKIKLEVDTLPPPKFTVEAKVITDPIPVSIKSYVLSDLFAGKMHAVLCRLWQQRIKGRDWYDFVWFVRRGIPLNLNHLEQRMWQSGCLEKDMKLTRKLFTDRLHEKITQLNVENALLDIRPFINDVAQVASWSKDYFFQFSEQINYL